VNLQKQWVELLFGVFLIIGIIISFTAPNLPVSFILLFLTGIMAGKMLYFGKKAIKLPTVLVIIGFILGYTLGTRFTSWKGVLLVFLLGGLVGFYIYEKGYLK